MSNRIKHCRVCGSKALTPAFSLGADNGWVLCDPEKDPTACGLLQRDWPAEAPETRERKVSRTVRHRLRATTTSLMEMLTARDAKALDIGCGDGTMLSFLPRWIECCGVDRLAPSESDVNWGHRLQGDFPANETVKDIHAWLDGDRFDIITATSVLGEQEEPLAFLSAMKSLLAEDGLIAIETAYASIALMRNNPAVFNADAKAVYTLTVMEDLARRAGLKIVRGGMTETDGGSLRLFLTHTDHNGYNDQVWLAQLARLWDEEASLNLTSLQTCQAFSWRMDRNRQEVQRYFDEAWRNGVKAHLIGADAGQLAMLDWFDLDSELVSAVITRDPDLHGQNITLGGGEPVPMLCERQAALPEADILIAPSSHRREALEHWREAIFDGAELVFLSPELSVVDDQNYATELGKALAITDGPGSVDTLRAVMASMQRPQLVSVSTGTDS